MHFWGVRAWSRGWGRWAAPAVGAPVSARGGELVVVTGAAGFVGSHVVRELLARGYRVRAAARRLADPARLAPLRALPGAGDRLEVAEVDVLDGAAVALALAGGNAVIHAASPYHLDVADPERDLVRPAVEGTRAVMRAAAAEPTITRVVVTSSVAALTDEPPPRPLDERDWNTSSTLTRNPYYLSKTLAERAAHELAESPEGARLRVVTLLPGVVLGPCLSSHVSESHHVLLDLLRGRIPGYIALAWGLVDVRDVARAHVDALEVAAARGRYVCVAGTRTMREVVAVLRSTRASPVGLPRMPWDRPPFGVFVRASLVLWPPGVRAFVRSHLGRAPAYDTSRIARDLAFAPRHPDETLRDTVESFLAHGHVPVRA